MADEIRLNRYLARCGLGSRRGSEDLIRAGRVSLNGIVVVDLSTKVHVGIDEVKVDGDAVALPPETITIMLHKPAGYVTTMHDPQGRPCVASLVPLDAYQGLFPVGRLDADTTGLLLFTTDGELGHALLHPRHHVSKTYYALVDGAVEKPQVDTLRNGVQLDDGMTQPAKVELLAGEARDAAIECIGSDEIAAGIAKLADASCAKRQGIEGATVLSITIAEGKKRQVKRMCSAIGHPVIALHRPLFASLRLDDLPRGSWRVLSEAEVQQLRASAGGIPSEPAASDGPSEDCA